MALRCVACEYPRPLLMCSEGHTKEAVGSGRGQGTLGERRDGATAWGQRPAAGDVPRAGKDTGDTAPAWGRDGNKRGFAPTAGTTVPRQNPGLPPASQQPHGPAETAAQGLRRRPPRSRPSPTPSRCRSSEGPPGTPAPAVSLLLLLVLRRPPRNPQPPRGGPGRAPPGSGPEPLSEASPSASASAGERGVAAIRERGTKGTKGRRAATGPDSSLNSERARTVSKTGTPLSNTALEPESFRRGCRMTEATALIVSTAHGFGSASNHRGRRSAPSPPSLLRTEMRPHRTAANAESRAPTRRDRCRPRRPPPALSTHLGASNTAPTPGARPGTQHAPPQPGTQLRTPAPSSGPHDAPRHPAHRRRIPSRTSGAARPPPRPIKHLRTPTRGQPPARARRSPGRPAWSGAERSSAGSGSPSSTGSPSSSSSPGPSRGPTAPGSWKRSRRPGRRHPKRPVPAR